MVANKDGHWLQLRGVLPPGSTVLEAELLAVIHAYEVIADGGCIVTDCEVLVKGWTRLLHRGSLSSQHMLGGASQHWEALGAQMRAKPRVVVRWTPAHLSKDEAEARGVSSEDWEGNLTSSRSTSRTRP